jgi:hypothetical protein
MDHKKELLDSAYAGVREFLDSIRGANLFGSGVTMKRVQSCIVVDATTRDGESRSFILKIEEVGA